MRRSVNWLQLNNLFLNFLFPRTKLKISTNAVLPLFLEHKDLKHY